MKNGINVSAISEFVHEIQETPLEGQVSFRVITPWRAYGGREPTLYVRPMTFGSKVHTRDFRLGSDHPDSLEAGGGYASPEEHLLAALSSCAMTIIVQGASYKKLSLLSLDVRTILKSGSQDINSDRDASNFMVNVRVAGEGEPDDHSTLLDKVRTFSPNYLALSTDTPIRLCTAVGLHRPNIDASATDELQWLYATDEFDLADAWGRDGRQSEFQSNMSWRYAVQMEANTKPLSEGKGGTDRGHSFVVDQPVLVGGLDLAPNPQEYLLAAIAGDVTRNISYFIQQDGLPLSEFVVDVSAKLDLRGVLNVEGASSVKVFDIVCCLRIGEEVAFDAAQLLHRAAKASVVCKSIVQPQSVEITLD